MTKLHIEENKLFTNKVKWVLQLLEVHYNISFILSNENHADHYIGISDKSTILLSENFYINLNKHVYAHTFHMPDGPFIKNSKNEIDYFSTIFYLVNCIQEYHSSDVDEYSRFKFNHSLQKKWNTITDNTVHFLILDFLKKYDIPYDFKPVGKILLSHDIDFINEGWKADLIWSLKKLKFKKTFKLLYDRFFGEGVYNNLNDLVKFEHSLGFESTFFWIPFKGKCKSNINNADYNILSKAVKNNIAYIKNTGSSNGLHKSSLDYNFIMELDQLGFDTDRNRFHYLKFSLPDGFDQIEKTKIKYDFSLGFPDQIGYRNNFGLPFVPFNLKEDKPYSFLVVPLNIMDRTLINHSEFTPQDMELFIINWIEKVKNHSLVSILWHNYYYSDYANKEMKVLYNNLLFNLSRQNFETYAFSSCNDMLYKWNID
jgi:hypothetical protein